MMLSKIKPELSAEMRAAFEQFDQAICLKLLEVRSMIFEIAASRENIGAITETLKWGQPSYLTEQTKSGTTIRLGAVKDRPDKFGIYVHCQTNLIESFRQMFGDEIGFEKNRAVVLSVDEKLPTDIISICILEALTYHQKSH